MKSISLCISSYQRRESLLRLLGAVADLAVEAPTRWAGAEVVVALDGSTDGSLEAVQNLDFVLPLKVEWIQNSGLAAARNRCLAMASGEIAWFFDDDLVPVSETIDVHRRAHEEGDDVALSGPCFVPPDLAVSAEVRQWWADLYGERKQRGPIQTVEQIGHMSIGTANMSVAAERARSVGGFDESFGTYGIEDTDFAVGLVKHGVTIKYDEQAVCWHYTFTADTAVKRERRRNEGQNTVKFLRKHPDMVTTYLPAEYQSPAMGLLDRYGIRSPAALGAVARMAGIAASAGGRLTGGRGQRLRELSSDAAFAQGVAETGPDLLPRVMGRGVTS